jgi:hypothetical protein
MARTYRCGPSRPSTIQLMKPQYTMNGARSSPNQQPESHSHSGNAAGHPAQLIVPSPSAQLSVHLGVSHERAASALSGLASKAPPQEITALAWRMRRRVFVMKTPRE